MTNDKKTSDFPNLNATREFRNPKNRAALIDSFMDKLEVIENLSPFVRMRVGILRLIQCKLNELEDSFFEERAALQAKYQKLYEPLYKRRCEVVNGDTEVDAQCVYHNGITKVDGVTSYSTTEEEVKGVPDFWLGAMKNNEIIAAEISKRDEGALEFLKDIKYSKLNKGFKLDFYFDTNPYFKNSVLSKVYRMIDEVERVVEKATGTNIEWLPRKCLTQKVLINKPKKRSKTAKHITKNKTCASFFEFFNPPQIPGDKDSAENLKSQVEHDYDIGETIRDHLIPHAVSWYMGEAAVRDDFENLEEDEEMMRMMTILTKMKPRS